MATCPTHPVTSASRRDQMSCEDPVFPEMGVSENSVPLNPMVNDHYPY